MVHDRVLHDTGSMMAQAQRDASTSGELDGVIRLVAAAADHAERGLQDVAAMQQAGRATVAVVEQAFSAYREGALAIAAKTEQAAASYQSAEDEAVHTLEAAQAPRLERMSGWPQQ